MYEYLKQSPVTLIMLLELMYLNSIVIFKIYFSYNAKGHHNFEHIDCKRIDFILKKHFYFLQCDL